MWKPASPFAARVVRVGVGEADEPEADCELEPHAMTKRQTAAAMRAVGRCNCHLLDSILVIPLPASLRQLAPVICQYKADQLRFRISSSRAGIRGAAPSAVRKQNDPSACAPSRFNPGP